MQQAGKILIIAGIALVGVGWILSKGWLERIGIGRLPGDIRLERGNFSFYFPLTTCLFASAILTILFWFFRK